MREKRKGQSTLEYILVFVAIVGVIAAVAFTKLKPAVEGIFDKSANRITNALSNF